ncbi:chitin deacetylase [Lichtheimia corymbifera JMRC:FSU:9682]|uniref:Chitin deacetylase n=1 Tax=Lichtheimia corymbifera JMRC:FSU:9682 TaxID=1263082 RepID=A0A068S3N5_9FUNG|nr:chitin deacetylase [Lichtheimia corymbifera JMRC:FSU:9682]
MFKTAILAAAAIVGAQAVTTNYTSTTDPTKINIPDIDQTTSHDPAKECTYYESDYTYNKAEWPTVWDTATTNGMNTSAEFKALWDSIDWSKAPNVQPRAIGPDGGLVMQGYDTQNDPDCWWSSSGCTVPKLKDVNADIYYCDEPETLGLTFDDGPNCSHNAFYDFLEQNKQKASMFYIGSNVLAWPYGALRGVKDGHHIAGHTWSHKLMTTLTNQEVLAELYYSTKAIKYVTGLTPIYWRPAQGDIDDRVRWIATQLNLTAILWNIDTDDWAANSMPGVTTETVQQNYKDFIEMGKNGSFAESGALILSHEINNMTMDMAMQNYEQLKGAYKHVIDVATCKNITNPYAEDTITFPTFEQYVKDGGKTSGGSATPAGDGESAASPMASINGALFASALFAVLAFA